jgi:hypothetical protein
MKEKICGISKLYVNPTLETCLLLGITIITFIIFYKYVYTNKSLNMNMNKNMNMNNFVDLPPLNATKWPTTPTDQLIYDKYLSDANVYSGLSGMNAKLTKSVDELDKLNSSISIIKNVLNTKSAQLKNNNDALITLLNDIEKTALLDKLYYQNNLAYQLLQKDNRDAVTYND